MRIQVNRAADGEGYEATWTVDHSVKLNRDGMNVKFLRRELEAMALGTMSDPEPIEIGGHSDPFAPIVRVTGNDLMDWCEWDVDDEVVCHIPTDCDSLATAVCQSFGGDPEDDRHWEVAMEASVRAWDSWLAFSQKHTAASTIAAVNAGQTWTRPRHA